LDRISAFIKVKTDDYEAKKKASPPSVSAKKQATQAPTPPASGKKK
jgi:hypothetical protein